MNLKNLYRQLISPKSWEINLGFLKLNFDNTSRKQLSKILSLIKARGVFNDSIPLELWENVLHSLKDFRHQLQVAYEELITSGNNDACLAVEVLLDSTKQFLNQYMNDFYRSMSLENDGDVNVRDIWSWNKIGDASRDLYILRMVVYHVAKNIEEFLSSSERIKMELPDPEENMYLYLSQKSKEFQNSSNVKINIEKTSDWPFKGEWYENKVGIAGDWTNWEIFDSFNVKDWTFYGHFPTGKYLYKLVVNNNWILDPINPLVEVDSKGNKNSVLNVSETSKYDVDSPMSLFDYYRIEKEELDLTRNRILGE